MRLFFSAGAGYSHIAPLLPLAVAARERGHDVVFATGENAVEHSRAHGVPTIGVDGQGDEAAARRAWSRYSPAELAGMSPDEKLAYVVSVMAETGAGTRVDGMLACVRERRPDLVIAGAAEFAAPAAAAIAGLPYVVHGIGAPKPASIMAGGWRALDPIVGRFGLDRFPAHDTVPYLDIWPEPLRPPGITWDHPIRQPLRPQGVLPADGRRPEVLDGLPYDKTVYVTAGTSHNTRPGVLETMISALHDERVNVVATIGRDGDRKRFGALPDGVRVENFLPQQRILPYVDAVVCHAGAGTVLGALAHGVPMVVSPLATDQFDMAAQVDAAGAGVLADPGSPTRAGIRDAVRTVLGDPAYRASAASLAAWIATMPGPASVLDRLPEYAN
ncbi:glycosyltransferase [Amycolatopsis keratiniphila]|uniref:glycosyltransferase n=1 Tax=Amycolatopsis keratiniphila TaxID=129921 RepID=UPI00087BBABA|nr:glycosyltransferase [Amycolatopsis keratiniphila]OLZ53030.1 glycosyltransferase [Amycolatopsis keratiniphila subsp. nogabecina]SDU08502.1 glycosyltransferase, MGT family [Amycolatopsis keratiniphila]